MKNSLLLFLFALLFIACGDDDSDFATRPSDDSSSSVCEDCDDESSSSRSSAKSSSSVTPKSSSSSKVPKPAEGTSSSTKSSSSSAKSSSSTKSSNSSVKSSSSVTPKSSSSSKVPEPAEGSSSSAKSSSSVGKVFESSFNPDITYGTMTDSRDKKVYKTVKIGGQTWMAENLNYADSTKTLSLLERSWCYNNDSANCAVAGRLYTWAAAIDSVKLATDADNPQDCGHRKTCTLPDTVYGICPPGWHLPTQTEWNTLFTEVGGSSTAGKILKSQTGWYNNGNGTDGVGFSALPAGYRKYTGYFSYDGDTANFWSATENNSNDAYRMGLYYSREDAYLYSHDKNYGFSVRCLQDAP